MKKKTINLCEKTVLCSQKKNLFTHSRKKKERLRSIDASRNKNMVVTLRVIKHIYHHVTLIERDGIYIYGILVLGI